MAIIDDAQRERLIKILLLTTSNHDGEALAALRKAQNIMSDANIDFRDLLVKNNHGTRKHEELIHELAITKGQVEKERDKARTARHHLKHARESARTERELRLESDRALEKIETQMKDVLEKAEYYARRSKADIAREIRSHLEASPTLSNRAIAARVHVSPQTVANHRRRLKTVQDGHSRLSKLDDRRELPVQVERSEPPIATLSKMVEPASSSVTDDLRTR